MCDKQELEAVLGHITVIGQAVADKVSLAVRKDGIEAASKIHQISDSDIIYSIDRIAENIIVDGLAAIAPELGGITLVAEGIGDDDVTIWPREAVDENTDWRILMDPIDGTRGLMVDKRSAFFLAGIARNKGTQTRLSDICAAVMVEIPTAKMFLADTFTAMRGQGIKGIRRNLVTGEHAGLTAQPSNASRIHGGFAQFARFFSPGKEILARLEEELLQRLYPDAKEGEIVAFEDQYISSGGQLYELLVGKDRFVGDVRGSLYRNYADTLRGGHVCHPYDLAAHLIGAEAGLIITGIDDDILDGPFTTTHPMDWFGYANREIYNEVSPVLNFLLKKFNLLRSEL